MIDPVLVEIVQGTLASIEAEVEEAIGRTARSPMIRDQHDFRAGIHDRRLRKLTGRSYSALVHPVVRDFPPETMRPGDVYFHNDVYLSEGGIGHLPDLCVTVPVFCDGAAVAFVQAFGHHYDIGGMVPGSMPSNAESAFQEGLMVPPVKLFDAGVPNDGVLRIVARNSRMPESLAGDIDAECAATRMGARRVEELFARYGRSAVEACFDAIIAATTETFRREVLAKIPDGAYRWEDYAEHDGVEPPRLHAQRMTLTKAGEKLTIDFTGTDPQAGVINCTYAGMRGGVMLAVGSLLLAMAVGAASGSTFHLPDWNWPSFVGLTVPGVLVLIAREEVKKRWRPAGHPALASLGTEGLLVVGLSLMVWGSTANLTLGVDAFHLGIRGDVVGAGLWMLAAVGLLVRRVLWPRASARSRRPEVTVAIAYTVALTVLVLGERAVELGKSPAIAIGYAGIAGALAAAAVVVLAVMLPLTLALDRGAAPAS